MRLNRSLGYSLAFLALVALDPTHCIAQSFPVTVEDLVPESDVIALGVVTKTDPEGVEAGSSYKMVFTRHTFKVETYYKGSGPAEISLFTAGGSRTLTLNGEVHRGYAQVTGSEQVSDGERLLVFLSSGPPGYVFTEWNTAKYPAVTDETSGETTVTIRLRKRAYMRGAALSSFDTLRGKDSGPDSTARLELSLKGTRGIDDVIDLRDLRGRLLEIIRGESG